MNKFIPREKLGKKARQQLDRARRAEWAFPPVTRRVESKKAYSRKRKATDRYGEAEGGFLFGFVGCVCCRVYSVTLTIC